MDNHLFSSPLKAPKAINDVCRFYGIHICCESNLDGFMREIFPIRSLGPSNLAPIITVLTFAWNVNRAAMKSPLTYRQHHCIHTYEFWYIRSFYIDRVMRQPFWIAIANRTKRTQQTARVTPTSYVQQNFFALYRSQRIQKETTRIWSEVICGHQISFASSSSCRFCKISEN